MFLRNTVVVMPALNECGCVGTTVKFWRALGAGAVRVVDNGSTDKTSEEAAQAGAEVVFEPERGYGAAAWRALQDWPEGMIWVLFSSADGSDQLSWDETVEWQAAIEAGADLVVGDRVSPHSSRGELNWAQRLGNWITCQAIWMGWRRRFNDLGSLRLARHCDLLSLGLTDRGFGWNVEMQIRAIERGWKIVERPVRYYPRKAGTSKISGSLSGTVRAGIGIIRMLVKLQRLRRPEARDLTQPLTKKGRHAGPSVA